MVSDRELCCPKCCGELRHYDKVQRIVRTKGRKTKWIWICRLRCMHCGTTHRALPESVFPYKQYEAEVIRGVLEKIITSETLGFEDYPCEATMQNWRAREH